MKFLLLSAGALSEIKAEEGTDINIGGVLAIIGNVDTVKKISEENSEKKSDEFNNKDQNSKVEVLTEAKATDKKKEKVELKSEASKLSPSVKKMLAENNLNSDLQ